MPTQNVNVTDRIADFVQAQIKSGNFKNASEVHRAALVEMECREEERQARIEHLKAEAQKGIDDIEAGRFITLDGPEQLRQLMDGVLAEVLGEQNLDAEPV